MLKKILFLLVVTCMFSCGHVFNNKELHIKPDKNFPQWLTKNGYSTEQTSGITYTGNDSSGNRIFLLADDTGFLHRVFMNDSGIVKIVPVYQSQQVLDYFKGFPKKDFEEITYDKYTGSVYLSVEGNAPDPSKYVGIFRLNFKNNDINSDTVLSVEKLDFKPQSLFLKYIAANIGYEGMAVDRNYIYLGLEGFSEGFLFADSTIILAADKKTLKIVKEINTKQAGIHTVCGLFSDDDLSLYGVDRNSKKLFHLQLDDNLDISDAGLTDVVTSIPGYQDFNYVASLESVTLDDKDNLYLVDDPWKTFFIPPAEVLSRLDSLTVNNFRNFIPVIYKFKLN